MDGLSPLPPLSQLRTLSDALAGNVSDVSGMMDSRQAETAAPPIKIKSETDETGVLKHTLTMDDATLQGVMQKMSYLDQALQAMTTEANRLQMREEQARRHPLMNALAVISGELAAGDKRLPPVVSALGRASLALNPPPDVLARERLGLQAEIGRLGMTGAQMALAERREQRAETQMGLEAEQKRTEARQRIFRDLGTAAQKGELVDAAVTAKMLQDAGYSKASADRYATGLVGISKEKQRLITEAETAKDARAQVALAERAREADNRLAAMMTTLGTKLTEKKEQDKAIEEAAQALAPMNKQSLSRLRDISSMFGAARLKIFARAREINPKFSTAELDRMADMEKSFTVGKDSKDLQSFDTFLQHAGELAKTVEGLYQTRSPAVNKSMNWWRKHMAGTPELSVLETSIEPVQKEFESFLLGGRALYIDDRRMMQKIMNENSSPAMIHATVKQMGKTARDRFDAMNQRYNRTMKEDIPNVFSPAAQDAARRIGVGLSPSTVSQTETETRKRNPQTGEWWIYKNGKWQKE